MFTKQLRRELKLEISLFLICTALTVLLYCVEGFKMVVLNLFYLPVVLAAFYLGRHRAGILALVCVLFASVAAVQDLEAYAAATSPLIIGLALTVWGAVMGLNSIFVGTLSDERTKTIAELHDAYVGVVEVLARYLKSADPVLNDRSKRVAALSEQVARQMRLSEREVDDVRIAALLQDVQNIEVTAKVIHRAVGDLKANSRETHTFSGSDLVHSLGSVLAGALPLIMHETANDDDTNYHVGRPRSNEAAFGAQILRTVTQFDSLVHFGPKPVSPPEAIHVLRSDLDLEHHPAVLHALEQVIGGGKNSPLERALAMTTACN
jgi:hypothetical protein